MSGNVAEWTEDWWGLWDGTPVEDPTRAATGTARAWRGGAINVRPYDTTVSVRDGSYPEVMYTSVGFRLARTAP